MSEPLNCPRCSAVLTDSEVRSLHKRYASAQRKTRSGGKNGGRPKADREIDAISREIAAAVRRPVARPQSKDEDNPPVRETQQERLVAGHGYGTQIFRPAEPGDEEWQDRVLVPIEDL